jgi:Zn-dependent peptidase ImmA (M78 family)
MFAIFPEILLQAEKGDIEALACLVRKYFGEQQVFVPNLRVAELCANAEIAIDSDIQKSASRLTAWDAHGTFRLAVSMHPEIKNLREQNYILARSLGHLFLDLQPKMAKGELQRTIFENKTSPLRDLLIDGKPASVIDNFALSLILPKAMVRKAMSALTSRKDVAAFFNVDLPLLEYRLENLGLFGAEKGPSAAAPKIEIRMKARSEVKPEAKAEVRTRAEPKGEAKADPKVDPKPSMRPTAGGSAAQPPKKREAEISSKPSPNQDLSSLARVNKSVAAMGYKKEGERTEIVAPSKSSPGLERLRQLARKIDKSVDE